MQLIASKIEISFNINKYKHSPLKKIEYIRNNNPLGLPPLTKIYNL